jgi:phosphonate transport system substrate-binding protein
VTAAVTPGVPGRRRSPALSVALVLTLVLLLAACGTSPSASGRPTLTIGAIPDQDPQKLQRLYAAVADRLGAALGVEVVYRPVTDYAAAVSLFRTGDLQLVWFGGLTGVQARLQTPGAVPVVQRDIDGDFHSLFLAGTSARLRPVSDVAGLTALKGSRFTFGSQSSTSGYLMPAYFLIRAGVDPQRDFAGQPGLSGSHDQTIDLVTSGTYQAGVVNEQVWNSRLAAGTIDTGKVSVLFRTPAYADYHWLLGPTAVAGLGADLPERVRRAFEELDPADPTDAQVLQLFGARRFVPTVAENYAQIEQVGRQLGLING